MDDIRELADKYKPDVVLLATGADGHKTDPLSSLNFDYAGYEYASSIVADIANTYAQGRVLIGGAGGYQPHTHTPSIWAEVVSSVFEKTRVSQLDKVQV
jgi:acetoin utilization protein AcuC